MTRRLRSCSECRRPVTTADAGAELYCPPCIAALASEGRQKGSPE